MKKVFKRVLPIFMVLVCLAFVSCHKDENTDPNNNGGNGNELPVDPNPGSDPNPDPNHPADNGYAKIRIEFSSNYKEYIDLRYYKIDVTVGGECTNATRRFNKRITESLAETPFVYETEFHYHGDVYLQAMFSPEMNGGYGDLEDPNDILSMYYNMKVYINDSLVDDDDFGLSIQFLPYAEF